LIERFSFIGTPQAQTKLRNDVAGLPLNELFTRLGPPGVIVCGRQGLLAAAKELCLIRVLNCSQG
jgi:hypothetical protein